MFSFIIRLISLSKSNSHIRWSHMLNLHMKSLLNVPSIHQSMHNHTNRPRIHIKHFTSSPMIQFVWHTFVLRTVYHNVYIFTHLVRRQISRNLNVTLCLKSFRKFLTSLSSITVTVSHLLI